MSAVAHAPIVRLPPQHDQRHRPAGAVHEAATVGSRQTESAAAASFATRSTKRHNRDGREAIIALEEETGEGIGVGRYVRSSERRDAAELGVTVVDSWQRRGLGALLLKVISARAREAGITTFTALMLA